VLSPGFRIRIQPVTSLSLWCGTGSRPLRYYRSSCFSRQKISYIANYPDAVLSPGFPSTPGDEPESLSAAEQRLFHLQRQLDIETKAGHPLLTMHRLFFTLIQCCGSMKLCYGSGSADPYLRLMDPDPDPAILISDLQEATKSCFFSRFFAYYFLKGHLHHFSKIRT
jgi:hypothetical protein